jgi:uncharacterized protein YnzC (UPF0291/DUF896 family)
LIKKHRKATEEAAKSEAKEDAEARKEYLEKQLAEVDEGLAAM